MNTERFKVTNPALNYAVNNSLPPISIDCSTTITDHAYGRKPVVGLYEHVEKDFRRKYPRSQQPLEVYHRSIESCGNILYIYLIDPTGNPDSPENMQLKPNPSKHRPLQRMAVTELVSYDGRKNRCSK